MSRTAIVVGGGAAGLFCAVCLARRGVECTLIEKNRALGRKLMITGKGRCNVTNNCESGEVMRNIPRNGRFMFGALSRFAPSDTMSFFEEIGVPLKTERGNRVFPVSDRAADIVGALEKTAVAAGVLSVRHEKALELIFDGDRAAGVLTERGEHLADAVVIATGGRSYPATGSTGDGYKFAESAGHTVTRLLPSLVPLETEEKEPAEMMGLSLKNVSLKLVNLVSGKTEYEEPGEMLFTHFGISGPLVLSASAHINGRDKYAVDIDLKPALSYEQLDARILRDFSQTLNRDFINSLGRLLPSAIIPIIAGRSGIPFETKVNSVTREQRQQLVAIIKGYRLNIKGFRPIDEAIITRGGVSVSEISPKTMESKMKKGLYFAGEIIDVDGYTGGFNLQIAFSTAYAAAEAIANS